MDAVTQVPAPVNEPVHDYAPAAPSGPPSRWRSPTSEARRWTSLTRSPASASWGRARRSRCASRTRNARSWARCATALSQTPRRRSTRPRPRRRPGGAVLRRPGSHPAQGRRCSPALAGPAQRSDDARPVQDRLPGRDRLGVRAHRLLAYQRPLRPPDPRRAAAAQRQGHLEPHGLPAARGLRLRDHPVQLHGHRRQPAHRTCPHGQHGGLEARSHTAVRRPGHHGAPRDGGDAARRHQPGHRRRHQRLQGGAERPRPRGHPLHRLHRDVPAPLAAGRREPDGLPQLPASRRRDRRQGLHPRPPPPTPTSCERP